MKKSLFLVIVFLSPLALQLSTLSAESVTVMSYNIRSSVKNEQDGANGWVFRKEAAVKMLLAEKPDVVGMQEEMPDQEAYFREHLASLYDGVAISRDPDNREDEACAIFYNKNKFDLVRTNTFWLSETPDVPSRGWDGKYKRIVTYVHLQAKKSGQQYLVFNTHLDHKGVVAREKSLQLIADSAISIGGDSVPMFVMGDLNVTPDAPELAPMWNSMRLAQREAPVTDTLYTFHGYKEGKGKIIDYIFYRNASPLEFRILRDGYGVPYLSDHYPISAVFSTEPVSKEVYNLVANHQKVLNTRNKRKSDWARFAMYEDINAELKAHQAKIDVVFYGNSITRNWYKMRPEFFHEHGYAGRGIGGQTSSELLVRMRQDVIDLHPKTVVIMCGTNDIAQNNGTISHEHTMGNIISMCELAKANKIRPVLCSVLPARSFRWNPFVPDAAKQIKELNRLIEEYARANHILYVDYYSAMVDTDGGLKKGLSNDNVHPTVEGYQIMEPIIVKALK
jgi:endonuclease/exonuclease/phosphatase family metal-dependent hydrolase/lysophospholipase L1-like esterase